MQARPWFDEETGVVLLDDYVVEMDSYQKVAQDAIVTDAEIAEQAQRVVTLLREVEGMLSDEAKAKVTEALCELSVLNVLQHKRLGAVW